MCSVPCNGWGVLSPKQGVRCRYCMTRQQCQFIRAPICTVIAQQAVNTVVLVLVAERKQTNFSLYCTVLIVVLFRKQQLSLCVYFLCILAAECPHLVFVSFLTQSNMDYSLLLLVCGVIHLADINEGISIDNCDSFLDIRENTENNITCKDIDTNSTVTWYIKMRSISASIIIATCIMFNCTPHQTGQFTVQRSPQESQLVYRQQNRTQDIGANIVCESVTGLTGGRNLQVSCDLNVISPANLSDCVVEEDRDKGTVKGSCHFEHAFSAIMGFTCTWHQTKSSDQSSTEYTGVIIKEVYTSNGQVYERGQCSLNITGQQWNDGDYSYSIDFYPGPGRRSVPVGSLEPPVSSTPNSGQQSTPTSSGAPPPAASDDEKGEKRVGISVVFAAVGATLAVVIVGIIAFVVWLRRRQWILPCAEKEARATLERCSFRQPAEATGERRESQPEIYEIPDTPHGQQGNSRRTHLRDNSPTTVNPTGDNSPTTESSFSPTGENSSTTLNNPPQTGDNTPVNNYESLRSNDMGLRSVYSALPGPDYYNTGFSAGGTGVSTADSTDPEGETSPVYEN